MTTKPKVRRTVIVVEVLSPGAEHLEFDSVEELGRYIDNGVGIGKHYVLDSIVMVDPTVIKFHLLGMGNDGTFFDYED